MMDAIRARMRESAIADEEKALDQLVDIAGLTLGEREAIAAHAVRMIQAVRDGASHGMMEEFLGEYGLSSKEGVALMCLAEALLRVPDAETIDDLIQDKIASHNWSTHLGSSDSSLVNASTWALMLTGRVIDEDDSPGIVGALRGVVRRLGEPMVRVAVSRAMREMGAQFVLGRTIDEAISNGTDARDDGYTFSYDMLGEAARTEDDAQRYHGAYSQAISAISLRAESDDTRENPGISVKLSALHPRYEYGQREDVVPVLAGRVLQLACAAKDGALGFNIDAEEQDRLDLSLDVIEAVLRDERLAGWDGFGVVVQAYGPRAPFVLDLLYALAEDLDRKIMVRLVKGAYWDTEIKRAQVLGLDGFPVFTRKPNTDVSYIACARKLMQMTDRIYPQFATHNAHTAAAVLHLAGTRRQGFEFQRLHGMGEALHDVVLEESGVRCRIYAPVGAHRDLLAYLVRRLLENGANSSFVHQIVDGDVPPETIARDPFLTIEDQGPAASPVIDRPSAIFDRRVNSKGWDITDPLTVAAIEAGRAPFAAPYQWGKEGMAIPNPAHPDEIVGHVVLATPATAEAAVECAAKAAPRWGALPVAERAQIINRVADLYECDAYEFFALAAREAGKIVADCVAEVREAVDFLRFYAVEAAKAERDSQARGVIVCISPWNFPLAIFTGQVAAALVTGNAVVAKPAEQTPLIAQKAVALMVEAGVPSDAIQLVIGDGAIGAALTSNPMIGGVCFTGSTEVAKLIDRQLAETAAPDAMLIAETGGLNAMIVDSTALPEQAIRDIVAATFQSAGQRCSALRILYLQRDIEERFLDMLYGAMDALEIGDPWAFSTDVAPVIDAEAQDSIGAYCAEKAGEGRLLKALTVPTNGLFVAPCVLRVSGIGAMVREVFGPVLHVARFDAEDIDAVVEDINARGYGLTMGLHTRIDGRVQRVFETADIGNLYINRNQIGAVVGSQPFGGEGLSGTGPKAGGPHYLSRFRKAVIEALPSIGDESVIVSASVIQSAFDQIDAEDWSGRLDRIGTLRRALRGKVPEAMAAAAALEQGPVDLPGPTGESNRLRLAEKGRVLCLGLSTEAAMAQAVQALATGNSVVAVAPKIKSAIGPLIEAGMPVVGIDGVADLGAIETLAMDAVAATGSADDLTPIRRALAARNGPILPLISDRISPALYASERALCIDTTAAGGNTALLARVGNEDVS